MRACIDAVPRVSITHELPSGRAGLPTALELLVDGLTFDLTGLAPSASESIPPVRHRFAVSEGVDLGACEALALRPGPHVAAAARSPLVVRTMASLAADLSTVMGDCQAIAWPPAAALIGPAYFASTVATWVGGGAFPALALTAFALADDGSLMSEGLAWFTGQEVALDHSLADDRVAATRLGVRLINQLVGRGRLTAGELVVGPDGERLALEPAGDVIRVRRG